MNPIRYIDLFAGAGGLSEGFIKERFEPIAHVEYDKAACYTLKTRLAYHHLSRSENEHVYISYLKGEIKRDVLYSYLPENLLNTVIHAEIGKDNKRIFKEIDKSLKGENVDLIIGGPPCQAYSVVGRAALKHKKNDERTKLYIQYGRFLSKYKPKIFVFENVPGILSAADGQYFKNLKAYYKRIGYTVDARLLNTYDYGVVQHRQRVIVVGWRKEMNLSFPEILPEQTKHYRDEIFNDLPEINAGESKRVQAYKTGINHYLSTTQIRNGIDFVTQHITRPHNKNDLKIYQLAIDLINKGQRIKNDTIPDDLRTQKNVTDFLDRFKVVDREPHTMIAHIAKDGHHFIHPDKKQLRSISVREAARIQSFPDNFYFEGIDENQPRTSAFRQIGNAVPPVFAKKLAEKLKEILND